MATETVYLGVADVIALHNAMMERLGVHPEPLRDAGLLESALVKPQMAAHYGEADLVRQGALLAVGIAQNQPFLDGNKRTAYTACIVFLGRNGWRFFGDAVEMSRQLELLAERTDSLDAAASRFEAWLREHVSG